jgi:hypothetical protein
LIGRKAHEDPKIQHLQIIGILKESEAGKNVIELSRKHAINDPTLYYWKKMTARPSVNPYSDNSSLNQRA